MVVLEEMVSSLGVEALILVEALLLLVEVLEEMAGVVGVAGGGVSNHRSNHRNNNNSNNNLRKSHHHRRHRHRHHQHKNLWEISVMQSILQSTVITELMAMLLQWSASLIYTGRRQLKITDSTI